MPANLENSAVATGLEKVSFHFNPKEGQSQRMFKLPHNCTHVTYQQSNAQNPSRQTSIIRELRTSRCSSWFQERQRNKRSNCQYPLDHSKRILKNIYFCFIYYTKAFDGVHHNKLENFLRDGNTRPPDLPPEKSVYRSRSNSQDQT